LIVYSRASESRIDQFLNELLVIKKISIMREFEVDRVWAYRDLRSGRSSGTGRIDRSKCFPGSPSPVVSSAAGKVARWGTGGCRCGQRGGRVGGEGAALGGGAGTPRPLRACSALLPSFGTSWSGSDGAQHSTASVGPGLWPGLGLRSRPVHMCLSQPLDKNPHRSRDRHVRAT
jgi:hypothetical protein